MYLQGKDRLYSHILINVCAEYSKGQLEFGAYIPPYWRKRRALTGKQKINGGRRGRERAFMGGNEVLER